MSKNHEPMHESGCDRCDRRRQRLAAYAKREAARTSPAGERAAIRAELGRMRRSHAYQTAPADPLNGRSHRHETGRRARLAAQQARNRAAIAAAAEKRHLEQIKPTKLAEKAA